MKELPVNIYKKFYDELIVMGKNIEKDNESTMRTSLEILGLFEELDKLMNAAKNKKGCVLNLNMWWVYQEVFWEMIDQLGYTYNQEDYDHNNEKVPVYPKDSAEGKFCKRWDEQ